MKNFNIQEAIASVAQGEKLTHSERMEIQKKRLCELVEYARANSPYFARHYESLPQKYSLEDIPPTEKGTLLENFNDWVTDRELDLSKVQEYLKRDTSDTSLLLGKYSALQTSGSTGTPLPMVRDAHRNAVHSSLIAQRLLGQLSMDLMDQRKSRIASIIHTSPTASSYASFLRMQTAYPEYSGNMLAISVFENIDSIVQKLNDFAPDTITGYPSMLVRLAEEKAAGKLAVTPKMIASSAELLPDRSYHRLREVFKCPVINNYCMTEGGEIAMTHNCPHLHINEDWIIVEPVDKDKNPIGMSEEFSEGILVTDLSNFIQPVIRYYVSDRVRIKKSTCPNSELPQLEIQGRVYDTFSFGERSFSTIALVVKAEVCEGLLQYQFIQRDKNTIEVRGIASEGYVLQEVLCNLCSTLKNYFNSCECPDAGIVYSLEPPVANERGGKMPLYIKL